MIVDYASYISSLADSRKMQNISLLLSLFLTNALCLYLTAEISVAQVIADNYFGYTNFSNDGADSAYKSNLQKLFSSLPIGRVAEHGFWDFSPNQISGLVFCRGDLNSSVCSDCLNHSFVFTSNHSYPIELVVYNNWCLLRYSNKTDLVSSIENYPRFSQWNQQIFNVWDPSNHCIASSMNSTLRELLANVSEHAAFNSPKRFETGMAEQKTLTCPNNGVDDITYSLPLIYGLSQCTANFSNDACHACLQDLIDELLDIYDGRQGGRIVGVKCNLRYETYSFISTEILPPTPSGQPPSPPLTQSGQPPLSSAPSNPPPGKSKGEKSTA